MRFAEVLASIQTTGNQAWAAQVGADWSQGRAVFGGLIAALGNEAMRRLVPMDRALRGLQIVFIGPSSPGTLCLQAEVMRVGKAVTIARAHVRSGDAVTATLTGVYGADRFSMISITPPACPDLRRTEALFDTQFSAEANGPAFLRHFDMRRHEGKEPYTGSLSSRSKVYLRHLGEDTTTESSLVALLDCAPTPVLQMLTTVAAASSLTCQLEFCRQEFAFDPGSWWRLDSTADGAGNGYVSQTSVLLNPVGLPTAFCRQLVAVYG